MQFECPTRDKEVYQLPDQIKEKVDEQYARDVARMNPEDSGRLDDEYNSFLKELGGGGGAREPPPRRPGAVLHARGPSGADSMPMLLHHGLVWSWHVCQQSALQVTRGLSVSLLTPVLHGSLCNLHYESASGLGMDDRASTGGPGQNREEEQNDCKLYGRKHISPCMHMLLVEILDGPLFRACVGRDACPGLKFAVTFTWLPQICGIPPALCWGRRSQRALFPVRISFGLQGHMRPGDRAVSWLWICYNGRPRAGTGCYPGVHLVLIPELASMCSTTNRPGWCCVSGFERIQDGQP